MKEEIKVGMALDDYKLKDKEIWWQKCLKNPEFKKQMPDMDLYEFYKEEVVSLTKDTSLVTKIFRLKK